MVLTPRFWILVALGLAPALLAGAVPGALWITLIYNLALVGVAIADLLSLPKTSTLEAERRHDPVLSLGAENPIRLLIRNRGDRPLKLRVKDEPPLEFRFDKRVFEFTLQPREEREETYHVKMSARGDYRFADLFIRCLSPLGLWWAPYRLPLAEAVKVYPNVMALRQYDLLRHKGHLREIGIRRSRLRGVGNEFESLREYTPDDEYRRIDWKATARLGKPITRQFEAERSQSVFLIVDAGRNMMAQVDSLTKLDHVMNAALMLGYAAEAAGDRLGLLTFNDTVLRYVPPKKGRGQIEQILEALHGVQAEPVEPNYPVALSYLARRWRRRSLVVVFTDVQEPETSAGLIQSLLALSRTHLCVCVTVADPKLAELAESPVENAAGVYTRAVALQVAHDRDAATRLLEQKGIRVISSQPETLSRDLVNHYMHLKERGAL